MDRLEVKHKEATETTVGREQANRSKILKSYT